MEKKKVNLWGLDISARGLRETSDWIQARKRGATVYCCTLNEVRTASENEKFRKILKRGTLLTADGMPLVWQMKLKNGKGERVYGPDLMRETIFKCKLRQIFIGDEKNKEYFEDKGEYIVLPYRNRFNETDYQKIVSKILKSRAKIVWVGLGSKKQVVVADELFKRLPDRIFVTVGVAFDYLSGNKIQAPKIIRKMGAEWLFRLICEPKRLWRRYAKIFKFLFRYYVMGEN